ncbi:MAG: hypothetical protein ACRDS0_25585 [Pseudonocardiaceae bacterium]
MSDAVSFAELDGQQVELLPERTVMSMFLLADGDTAGNGGAGTGGIGADVLSAIGILAPGTSFAGAGIGGAGGAINPPPAGP